MLLSQLVVLCEVVRPQHVEVGPDKHLIKRFYSPNARKMNRGRRLCYKSFFGELILTVTWSLSTWTDKCSYVQSMHVGTHICTSCTGICRHLRHKIHAEHL